jgi:hypothetical protein
VNKVICSKWTGILWICHWIQLHCDILPLQECWEAGTHKKEALSQCSPMTARIIICPLERTRTSIKKVVVMIISSVLLIILRTNDFKCYSILLKLNAFTRYIIDTITKQIKHIHSAWIEVSQEVEINVTWWKLVNIFIKFVPTKGFFVLSHRIIGSWRNEGRKWPYRQTEKCLTKIMGTSSRKFRPLKMWTLCSLKKIRDPISSWRRVMPEKNVIISYTAKKT